MDSTTMLSLVLLGASAISSTVTGLPPGNEAEERRLWELATCQVSWLPWLDDKRRMTAYIDGFDADYTRSEDEPAFLPKGPSKLMGFPLIKVYPQSVGMGVGFSLQLAGTLAKVRVEVEHLLGKPLDCSVSDEMTSCGFELDPKRTITLAADGDGTGKTSLLGCFYYYEK
jgi:hypothetical protein